MHDDYGEEPSWPVAVVVRVRTCVGRLFGRGRPRGPAVDDAPDEEPTS
ncbi:MAG: hypothetical protein QOE74_5236 [Mycobacterium sp.]|nr:hypothetical protein [Mycobacterium sp.]